jgi:hypothetical protein
MRISIVIVACLVVSCGAAGSFGPPDTVQGGVYTKVDRTVENRLMADAAATLDRMGLQESFGAAYEFLTYKPQFFLGAGRGSADRLALMERVLPLFGGEAGPSEPPRELRRDRAVFLCAPYGHTGVPGTEGTGGLASIAAVCTWSDGGIAGFGVGVAGLSVEDVLALAAEARTAVED